MYLSKITKCISVALCALLLCTLMPSERTEAAVATSTGFTVNVSSASGNTGAQILVPVNFANVPANGISTADMTITYDSTKLEYVSGSAGSIVTNAATNFAINKEKDGTLKALFLDYTMSNGYISSGGTFTNLTFKVLSSSSVSTNVNITSASFGDKNLSNVTATMSAGAITLNGGGTVATPTPTKTTTVTTPAKTTTSSSGFTVNVSAASGNSGAQIVVPVDFESVPANGISTADMTISYDSTKLEYVSGAAGNIVTNAATNFAINKESDGKLKVLFLDYTMATGYITQSGVFANLTFKALSSASTTVNVTSATFGDKNLNTVSAKINAGTITIGGGTVPTAASTTAPTAVKTVAPTTVKTAAPTTAPTAVKTTAPTGFTVYVDSVSGKSGAQIVVPVNLVNVPANGVSTADMTITYDSTKLEYVSGAAGSIVTNAATNFAINKESDGKIKILFLDYTMATEYIKQGGVFANLTFKVLTSSAVSTNVSISGATLGDKNLDNVSAKLNAGTIALNGGGAVATTAPVPTAAPTTAPTAVKTTAPTGFTVYVDSVSGKSGAQIVVPVNLVNVPANGISTADMTITYDSTKLEYVSGEAGSIVTNAATNFAINKESNGKIKILFLDYTMATEYIKQGGVFANLTFKVLTSSAVSTNVSINGATLGDKNLDSVSAKLNAGTIALNGGGAVVTPVPTTAPTTAPTAIKTNVPTGFTVYVDSVSGKSGEQIVVPVNFVNVPASGVSTADMTITYDAAKLEYVSGAAGSIVTNATTNYAINKESNGKIKVLFLDYTMATEYINKSGVFTNLTFKVITSSAVSTNVSISAATFGDKNLAKVTPTLSAGIIALNGGGTVIATPTTTPTPIPTSVPTQNPTQSGNYSVSYTQNAWGTGATVSLTIKNNGSTAANGWKVNFNFAGNQKITNSWNCGYTQNGNAVVLTNAIYNSSIPAGGSVTIGFNISYSGTNTVPTNFTVDAASSGSGSGNSTPTTQPSQNCSASYTQNAWGTGATVNITIKNNSSTAVNGWTVNFNYAGNQKITNGWNCDFTQNGNAVTLKNVNYNGTIPAGGSVSIGFNISYSGTNTIPTNITVN